MSETVGSTPRYKCRCVHAKEIRQLEKEIARLKEWLGELYDKWENGTPCHEDAEEQAGYIGHAFTLTEDEENALLKMLPPIAPSVELRAKLQTAEATLAQLSDSSVVHSNILRGTIALTKAQAIHIAGLPADIETSLAEAKATINKLETHPAQFMVEGGPVVMAADYEKLKAKLRTAEATLGTLMLWIEQANAKVTSEEWQQADCEDGEFFMQRWRIDALLASRLQQLREKVAELQLSGRKSDQRSQSSASS